jgi:eukaryotic-like serine/threonine-protein kinase
MAVLSRRFLESRMWGHMSTTDLPGSSLLAGRYRLVERLGAGGMSVVWRGFDEVLGRQVAVKVLPPSTSADPSFRRRLRAEAQAAARLSHPHITNVYDYGEATTIDGEPVPYVVMELVDGESLAAVLARVRRLSWPAAVRICAEVSAALAAAHSRGIVHRDVTPANVMLTSSGAKVVDFGISALIGENDIDPDGSLLGTPAYLAPERLEGGQVSPATDVYAVGLLIYRTLIGQLPWDVGTTTALLRAHQYTEPEPLPPVEGLPSAVAALIGRCLEKRPDDRPSSAELAKVLAGAVADVPADARDYILDRAAGEDTTILPAQHPFTDGIGRIRPGHAKVADAPVSPAPGSAIPVPVSDVQAAVAGAPVSDVAKTPAPFSAAGANSAPPAGAPAGAAQPLAEHDREAGSAPPGGAPADLGSGPGDTPPAPESAGRARNAGRPDGVRNSRFAGSPRPRMQSAADAAVAPAPGAIRHAVDFEGNSGDPKSPGGSGTPPTKPRPASPGAAGRQRRRILVAAGLLVLAIGAVYAYSVTAQDHNASIAGQPRVVPPDGNCVVSYAVWSDDVARDTFKAQVTVANRDAAPIANWRLWFVMNGDQVVSSRLHEGMTVPASYPDAKLTQQATAVTIASRDALTAQRPATMTISGRYQQSNAAPMVFKLNDKTCETFVSSKPGEPSRPVEHLSNGTTRLGPVPNTPTPVPGITIGSNGIAQVHPTVKPTAGPGGTGAVLPPGQPTALAQTTPVTDPPPSTQPPPPPTDILSTVNDATTPPTSDSSTVPAQTADTASEPADSDDLDSAAH